MNHFKHMLGNVAKHGDWPITARVRNNLLYIYTYALPLIHSIRKKVIMTVPLPC